MEKIRTYGPWIGCTYIAFVFVQSLFFKFAGAAEPLHIFGTLTEWSGLPFEPYGRFGVGIVELIASILLFVPALRFIGAGLAAGTMAGAIFFHLFTPLGIVIENEATGVESDGGLLFVMACGVFAVSLILLWLDRAKVFAMFGMSSGKA